MEKTTRITWERNRVRIEDILENVKEEMKCGDIYLTKTKMDRPRLKK